MNDREGKVIEYIGVKPRVKNVEHFGRDEERREGEVGWLVDWLGEV